eukprot:651943-Hanusia_phi.AAC.1
MRRTLLCVTSRSSGMIAFHLPSRDVRLGRRGQEVPLAVMPTGRFALHHLPLALLEGMLVRAVDPPPLVELLLHLRGKSEGWEGGVGTML